jgi:hypothetical protein
MVRQIWILSLAVFFAAISISGCQLAERRPYQGDPLLAYKKPVTDLPRVEQNSILLAYAEPRPPNLPQAAALADAGKHTGQRDAVAASTVEDGGPKMEGSTLDPRLEVFLTSRRKVSGIHGHAKDYSWLQGTLERESSGGNVLVYLARGERDALGGRVSLRNDDRLSAFRPGDVILVEGKLDRPSEVARDHSGEAPFYQIRQIWLVRQAD